MEEAPQKAIDCHCHIYPEKISGKAVEAVGDFYKIDMDVDDGTANRLLEVCKGSPIEQCFVYSVATKPTQVSSINDFIAGESAKHPELIGFMTLHQDMTDEELEREIDRASKLGLRGIKLHPDTQAVDMDDPRLMRIYEIAQGRLPIVMHCGDYRYDFSHPRKMKRILHDFPDLVVNAAHFGGWSIFDLALEYLKDEDCYVDVSSSMSFIGLDRTLELTRLYGTNRVMFGSDFPMWNPVEEYGRFTSAGFSDVELRNLLRNNAIRFLDGEKPLS